jgi:membrane associated rhomboid family serine protease
MKNNNIKYINNINSIPNKNYCARLCEVIPLFIKLIVLITITLYIINRFAFNLSLYISNIPFYTIYKYQIWRLFSTSLMNTGIINIALSLVLWIKLGAILEDSTGTILYLFIFIINSTLIQIIYTILIFVISLVIKNKNILLLKLDNNNIVTNSGIWPYIISELTLLSLSNPNQIIKLFFFPDIKAKFYPIIVFIIFALLNNLIIDLEVFCGILYSFLYHFFIKSKLNFSKKCIKNLEDSKCIKCFSKCGGFISIRDKKFSDYRTERNVVVNSNLRDYESCQRSDTNINIKEGNLGDAKGIQEQNKKSMDDTLDVKIKQ